MCYLVCNGVICCYFLKLTQICSTWEFFVEQIVMALSIGVCSRSSFGFVEVPFSKLSSWSNFSKGRLVYPVVSRDNRIEKPRSKYKCFASRGNVARELDSEENASVSSSEEEEDLRHVMKFKMSDFKIHDRVSIGLGNRVRERKIYCKCFFLSCY